MSVLSLREEYLYPQATLPYGVTTERIALAVGDFLAMFQDINDHVLQRGYGRLETLMREATFSDFVGESLTRALPKHCHSLTRNLWNNGYPDLLARADNPGNALPRGIGIEVKASRASGQWQAHNREEGWFMVFRFVADTKTEGDTPAVPFEIVEILAAELAVSDWSVSRGAEGDGSGTAVEAAVIPQVILESIGKPSLGEAADSMAEVIVKRRTRTTSTNASGTRKLRSNPVYANPKYVIKHKDNPLWRRMSGGNNV